FWEIIFLNKHWSDQTLRIWECYQRYEIDEIEERERDNGGNPLIAQTTYLSRESNPKETLKLTYRQKNPKMFTGLETLEEGVALGTSGGSQRKEITNEEHVL
ncbi:Bgt-50278, partial [Blumeria graminis f. sp. tritici]